MRLVSVFNILTLSVNILSLTYECQTASGIYCSPIQTHASAQYIKIIVGEFLSSVFRLMSNFAYVGFSISRLSLIGKKHGKFIKNISSASITVYIIVSFIFSVSLSIVKLFRYQVIFFQDYLFNQQYPVPYDRNFNNIYSHNFKIKARVINVFNAICDLTNYLIFMVINTVLDLMLIAKLKKTLSELMNANKRENQLVLLRVITSIALYALLSTFLKLPSAFKPVLDSIHLDSEIHFAYTFEKIDDFYENICLFSRFCFMFEKLAAFLFSLSLSICIFFYYILDKKFMMCFKIAFSKITSSSIGHQEFIKLLEDRYNFK